MADRGKPGRFTETGESATDRADQGGVSESLSRSAISAPTPSPALADAVAALVRGLAAPADPGRVLEHLIIAAAAIVDADGAMLCLHDPTTQVLQAIATSGTFAGLQERSLSPDRTFLGNVFGSRGVCMLDLGPALGLRDAAAALPQPGLAVATGPASILLVSRAGQDSDSFTQADQSALEWFASTAAAAIEGLRSGAPPLPVRGADPGEEDLVASLALYEAAAAASSVVVFEWDPSSDRILWGGTVRAIFGYTPSDFGSTRSAWLNHVHPEDRALVGRLLSMLAEEGGAAAELFRLQRVDGFELRVLLRARRQGQGRSRLRVVGALEDVTGREAREESNTEQTEMLFGQLRHEVNNALAIVLGQTQLLQEDPSRPLAPHVDQGLSAIREHGLRIRDSIRRLSGAVGSHSDPVAARVATPWGMSRSSDSPWELTVAFGTVADSLSEGVLFVDAEAIVHYANPQVAELVGRAPQDLIARELTDALSMVENPTGLLEHFRRHLAGTAEEYEARCGRTGTDLRWIQISGTPFRGADGQIVGVLYTITDISERKRRERAFRQTALQDPLTGLANRTLLMERLIHAVARTDRRPDHQFAVLFLDLDDLKAVNDTLGHAAGDDLLVRVSRRLRICVRPEDTVARYGGDEFAILLEGIQDVADAIRVAERIQEELAGPVGADEPEITPSVSIGIALSNLGADTPDEVLRKADAAMYRAKALGRGRYDVFDREMHAMVQARQEGESALRRALDRGEFRLLYQPVFSLASEEIVGVEALLRWAHPERGVLLPADFIPLAEESGFMVPIGEWVLASACQRYSEWRDRLGPLAPRWIAVNLSSRQLLHPGFADRVRRIVTEAGLDPRALKLEITETTLFTNGRAALSTLETLSQMGVRFHLDDFGTGYSSLANLHRLPIDALKIHSSFVERTGPREADEEEDTMTDARFMIRAILNVAEGIGATTIAEAIGSAEQLAELRQLGCPYGQGYVFAHPLDAAEMRDMLGREPGRSTS